MSHVLLHLKMMLDIRTERAKMAPNTDKTFTLLPLELVQEISSLLKPTELCAIRTTCKALNTKTFTPFWRRSLHTIKTDLSLYSLQKLKSISKHPKLRHYVHHLIIKGFDKN